MNTSTKRWYRFFRPTLIALVGLCIAIGVSELLSGLVTPEEVIPLEQQLGQLTGPAPELSPEDVVQIQIRAMADPHDPVNVMQCMCFASPQNRMITGPLARFGTMLQSPRFNVFQESTSVLVGKSQMIDNVSRVFVTVVDSNSQPHAFVWVLGMQTQEPFVDCWMTESVMRVAIPEFQLETQTADPDKVI